MAMTVIIRLPASGGTHTPVTFGRLLVLNGATVTHTATPNATSPKSVTLTVKTASFEVLDPGVDADDKAKITKTLEALPDAGSLQVRPDGRISTPLVEDLQAAAAPSRRTPAGKQATKYLKVGRRNLAVGIGSTDHVAFNDVGVPGFTAIKDFEAYDERTRHTNADWPERMSEDELKQLVAWLESPVNKKFQQAGPEMQSSLVKQVVAETSPVLDPKLRALQVDELYRFAGIRYVSRLSNDWVCWAIFPGVELEQRQALPIEREMPALVAVAERFGLRVF